jgi:hypothetical protein
MNLLLLLLLALPFACLAVLSLVALLGVVAIGGTLRMIGMVTSVLGLAGRKVDDPWHGASVMLTRSTTLRSRDSGQRLPTGPQRWA